MNSNKIPVCWNKPILAHLEKKKSLYLDFDIAWALSLFFLNSLAYLCLIPIGEESVGRICSNTMRIYFFKGGVARIGFLKLFYSSKGRFAAYYLTSFCLLLSHGSERMCRRLSIRESNTVIYIYRQLCFPENFFFVGYKSD